MTAVTTSVHVFAAAQETEADADPQMASLLNGAAAAVGH